MPRPTPTQKIARAAAMSHDGKTNERIAAEMGVNIRTLGRWTKTPEWRDEMHRLNTAKQQAAVEVAVTLKEEYKAQLLKSRDLIRQTADQQVQVAGQLSIAASRATRDIMQANDPIQAVSSLSRGGTCNVALTASQVARAAKDLLNEAYAINRVLEFLDGHHT